MNCIARCLMFTCAISFLLIPQSVSAQSDGESTSQTSDRTVLAQVAEFEISDSAVRRMFHSAAPELDWEIYRESFQPLTVQKMIDQRIVYEYLKTIDHAAGVNEITIRRQAFVTELAKIEQTLDGYLAKKNITIAELEFEWAWQIAWTRFLKHKLTDEAMEQFFRDHQRQFDGTELRVAHLLIAVDQSATEIEINAASKLAEEIYGELKSGSLTWESAVQAHSTAPTKDAGGELGWIRVDEPMPIEFSKAAFTLAEQGISPPVQTSFGIHLIKCLEIKPGKIGWRDAETEVRDAAAVALFDSVLARHRGQVEVKRF